MVNQNCKNLYKKYEKLRKKVVPEASNIEEEKAAPSSPATTKDTQDFNKIKEKLKDCLDFLCDDQLVEVSKDSDFTESANETLRERGRAALGN